MNINLINQNLTEYENIEIKKLLEREDKTLSNDLEQMWHLIDLIWDDYGCDNRDFDWEKIGNFYSHPVWVLNCLFAEQDETSRNHRIAVSHWVSSQKFNNVLDYGGGSGALSQIIAEKDSNVGISIYEPYPSDFGIRRLSKFDNINFIRKLDNNNLYDCLISTDVLEHVVSPLEDFYNMIQNVKINGYLVIGCPFYPVIKCHLPKSFHFRYSFNIFAKLMGLTVIGQLEGSPETIFKKTKILKPNWTKIKIMENLSIILFPFLEIIKTILTPAWRVYKFIKK